MIARKIHRVYCYFLSDERRRTFEKIVFWSAILFFAVHSLVIIFVRLGLIPASVYMDSNELPDPLTAIYTPFSIILLYEIYLLIYYLPRSITYYLAKQYEIIALIFIRSIFEIMSRFSAQQDEYTSDNFIEILQMFGGLIALCLLIFCYYKLAGKKDPMVRELTCTKEGRRYITVKQGMALILLVVFLLLFIGSISEIVFYSNLNVYSIVELIKRMSYSFFNTFFTVLILIEVLVLLFTFDLSGKFTKVIRNSGFIISTILLKLSFRVDGGLNIAFILMAVAFGVAMLAIDKLFEKKLDDTM